MKKKSFIYIILSLVITLGACNDPVFYIISVESPIAEPLIGGSPTNFVELNNNLYVASGSKIYRYNGSWEAISRQPDGRVVQLAATDNYLYALYLKGSGRNETRHIAYSNGGSGNWTDMNVSSAKKIFAANNILFICAGNGDDDNKIFYANEGVGSASQISGAGGKSLLNGVVYDGSHYFLCTESDGIYYGSSPSAAALINGSNKEFTGIINLSSSYTVAITRSEGTLFKIATTGISDLSVSFNNENHYSNGALAVWTGNDKNGNPRRLLLAGRQDSLIYAVDSGYTYGYMEIELELTGGLKSGSKFVEPGGDVSSTADYERYVSTIGKHPVNYIFQAADGILFASTHMAGVWSCRLRDGILQWNAEE